MMEITGNGSQGNSISWNSIKENPITREHSSLQPGEVEGITH